METQYRENQCHTTIQTHTNAEDFTEDSHIRLAHPTLLKHVQQKCSVADQLSVSQILQNLKFSSYLDFFLHKLWKLISFISGLLPGR